MLLTDVVGNEDTIHRLRAVAELGNMPNLVLAGPPGCGKTTSIHCLARQMLVDPALPPKEAKQILSRAVLELNA